jgi:hypothetical protein
MIKKYYNFKKNRKDSKMIILNLTQHNSTLEQKGEGVIDLPETYSNSLKKLLTFDELPSKKDIENRAEDIYKLVISFTKDELSPIKEEVKSMLNENGNLNTDEFKKFNLGFMLGGAPWLMPTLTEKLKNIGTPLFSFTKREVKEIQNGNEVKKISIFKHIGFIEG